MTPSRYAVARVAQAFGYVRKNHRMTEASSEMHLLREAEAYLGSQTWQKVEKIEDLSVEYWNLRKLVKEQESIDKRMTDLQRSVDLAHEKRTHIINGAAASDPELVARRAELLRELENLSQRKEAIVAEAREVRRIHDGLRTKAEVLASERGEPAPDDPDFTNINAKTAELKRKFETLRRERIEIGERIRRGDDELDAIDAMIRSRQGDHRQEALAAFAEIGEGNREISALRAEAGVVETRIRQLHAQIGRHLSRNNRADADCAAAVEDHRSLVEVMRALRRSIALNQKLAGTA